MLDPLTFICLGGAILMLGLSLHDWRVGLFGLLAFLPFAGIPTILLYPAPPVTRIMKDLIFVVPAYAGFVTWSLKGYRNQLPRLSLWLMVALVALAAGRMLGTDVMVGLIGVKTWVFYLPLLLLGYSAVGTVYELNRFVRFLLLVAFIPVVLGVLQAALLYGGSPDLAYGVYGDAAFDVTQGFGRFEVGTGDLARMASTFTFVSQYYNFLLATICLAYGHWRTMKARSASRFWFGLVPLAVVVVAGLLSGARGAFVMIPLFFVIALLLDLEWVTVVQIGGLVGGALAMALTLFKTTSQDLFGMVRDLSVDYLTVTQVGEMTQALGTTLWGLGTGTNTGPARFAIADPTVVMLENYYAKTVMELGLLGLLLVLLLFATAIWYGYKATRSASPMTKSYASALCAFLIVSVINEWKGSYLDIDPLNVYFWLFLGLLLRIPTILPVSRPLERGLRRLPRLMVRPLQAQPALVDAGRRP
jgi:hypothetical protein